MASASPRPSLAQVPRVESFAESQISAPGRYNFHQGATYRLKLTNIPGAGREGLVLYPTLQVYPSHPQTEAFLSHNAVPLQITEEDLDQVQASNFVTKVIYLPSAEHQELAVANIEQLVSTRLDPGLDPVAEADRAQKLRRQVLVRVHDHERWVVLDAGADFDGAKHVIGLLPRRPRRAGSEP